MKKKVIIQSHGTEDTRRVGRLIGRSIKPGTVIALSGELGSGKTQIVKGLARGLGVDRNYHVSSPSYVLINEYPGKIPLYHVDLYRLAKERELEDMGLEEYVYGNGVAAIEWAEKAVQFMPSQYLWIEVQWVGPKRRKLICKAVGKPNVKVLEAVLAKAKKTGP